MTSYRLDSAAVQAHETWQPPVRLPRPVRVMHLVFRLYRGGMEHNVVKLVNALERSRVTSSICSCMPADSLKLRLAPDVPLFELTRHQGTDVRLILRLARLFRRERPDVLHTHSWGTLCEGFLAARLARIPVVVHGEHGTMELRPRNRAVQRFLWSRVDQVLSVSSRLAERMAATMEFPEARIAVIRNGVDLTRFTWDARDAVRRELDVAPDECLIGTVGRLEPVKDHATLLSALALLAGKEHAFRAVIVGEGSLMNRLDACVSDLRLGRRVRLLGPRADVERILAALDVFTLTSRSEGLPNTVLEGMAAGLPVVATDVGGTAELVTHGVTGLLVPPEDPAALADAFAELLTNHERRAAMATAARQRAEREFTLDRMVRRYQDLYVSLAGPTVASAASTTCAVAGAPEIDPTR